MVEDADGYWERATAHYEAERLGEARAELEDGLRLFPEHGPMHYLLGYLLAEVGRLGEAAEHFREAARLTDDWEPLYGQVYVLARQLARRMPWGRCAAPVREARSLCRQLLQKDLPIAFQANTLRLLSRCQWALGDTRSAMATTEQLLALDPSNADGLRDMTIYHLLTGQWRAFGVSVKRWPPLEGDDLRSFQRFERLWQWAQVAVAGLVALTCLWALLRRRK